MKIIGIRRSAFKGDDGSTVEGVNFYLSYPLEKGEGLGTDRVYVTTRKLEQFGLDPVIGDEVRFFYNRWSKVTGMEILNR